MQVPWNIRVVILLGVLWVGTPVLAAQWNTDPIWEYKDDSPVIPADVRLKLWNVDKAFSRAYEYHNKKFKTEFNKRETGDREFADRWKTSFVPYWTAFVNYLYRYTRSAQLNASYITADSKILNLEHSQLHGTTLMVARALVRRARDLTSLLEDGIVIKKWEIFIDRLETLEDTIKKLK